MSKKYKFFNRELSWIEFNARVLSLAERQDVPLLERVKFLGIVSSNFDEFFMIRVAGLKRKQRKNPEWKDISDLTAAAQLKEISKRVHEIQKKQYNCFNNEILPSLQQCNLKYINKIDYTEQQYNYLKELFLNDILPLLTPLRTGFSTIFPRVSNLRLHAAFLLKSIFENKENQMLLNPSPIEEKPIAIVQIPSSISRIVWLPDTHDNMRIFTTLDDVIQTFGTHLFPGFSVEETLIFKITRDADFAVDEERSTDFIQAMEEALEQRQSSFIVRIMTNNSSKTITKMLTERLGLQKQDVYEVNGLVDLGSLMELATVDAAPKFKYPQWKHFKTSNLLQKSPWDVLKVKDELLHVPYESYDAVITFLNQAADDTDVLAIKITLYRTSGNSPIVQALERAARNGKHVTAFVELKARFDEKRNISWVSRLERAGVIVVYGIANLKVHAKLLLVIRREYEGIQRYVHLSTGNFNDKTARTYADFSLFTSRIEIANDATAFFNIISGYSSIQTMKRLAMAPIDLKTRLLDMIERETAHAKRGMSALIMAKMNSLGHEEIVRALYNASNAGVNILLNVRGICMLVPGVKNMSENISVVSIIDRYLEHERIFYFQNGGDEELYLSSADWMPRNLDHRVELMFPIIQDDLVKQLKEALHAYFNDNIQAFELKQDGTWHRKTPTEQQQPVRAQDFFYFEQMKKSQIFNSDQPKEFVVRRNS
ncbi:MAG: polyphosphate kinase 1 [Treponema sp.]|jgi:polyphosphate kinase|nr:polyphosphate kinase 1 [Treponema sp.]